MKKLITVLSATALLVLTGAAAAANKTVTLAVDNMTCAVCPITVKKALNSVAGVSKTEVSYERKEAVVTYDDAKTDVESLKTAMAYGTVVASFTVEDFSLRRFQRTDRDEIERRLGTYRRMMAF